MDLHLLWFGLLLALLAGYAVLDGLDLGVGILHLLVRGEEERRILMHSVVPIWDGNEVWLVAFGGATFAAFPEVYATIFSGFYLIFMLVLLGLICRAVSLEFREKVHSSRWRRFWDRVFCLSSLGVTFLYGLGVGNALIGIPLDSRGVFIGRSTDFFHPYAWLVALLILALFAFHGSLFLDLKTEGPLQKGIRQWRWRAYWAFLALYLVVMPWTIVRFPRALSNLKRAPWTWAIVLLHLFVMLLLPLLLRRRRGISALAASSLNVALLVALFGLALFPNLILSSPAPENSLTLYNGASSLLTLKILTAMAAFGLPFVIAYTVLVYRVFRGKTDPDRLSY